MKRETFGRQIGILAVGLLWLGSGGTVVAWENYDDRARTLVIAPVGPARIGPAPRTRTAQQALTLLKLRNNLAHQKETLNVLLGRDVQKPFRVVTVSTADLPSGGAVRSAALHTGAADRKLGAADDDVETLRQRAAGAARPSPVGQIYLVVLVTRLVGIHIAQQRERWQCP
jgi:hypothetical protein